MKRKILLFITLILLCRCEVFALSYGGCDYSVVSRMKSIVTNINIYYDYHIENNSAYFDVTLTNITTEVYFVDSLNNKEYTYSNTNNGEITIKNYMRSGSYKFYSNVDACYGITLGTKYYTFPTYNPYYNSEECKDIPNFSLCQKWANVNYSSDKFKSLVLSYKNSLIKYDEGDVVIEHNDGIINKIMDIYVKYYYYFLGGIIIICGGIILIMKKNNKFKL